MRYIDSVFQSTDGCLGAFFDTLSEQEIVEARLQTGFFNAAALVSLLPIFSQLNSIDGVTRVLVGANEDMTTRDDVVNLFTAMGMPRQSALLGVVAFQDAFFHPKTYHFRRRDGSQVAYVGSANLTVRGLARHIEAGMVLDTKEGDSPEALSSIAKAIDMWFDSYSPGLNRVVDLADVDGLCQSAILPLMRPVRTQRSAGGAIKAKAPKPYLPPQHVLPHASSVSPSSAAPSLAGAGAVTPLPQQATSASSFVMTLQQTDVGVGQTSKGTSRRSPEVFIPLSARDHDPAFWDWPDAFTPDVSDPRKMDRKNVRMAHRGSLFEVNMMTWPAKSDFRLRSEALRSAGQQGDLLILTKANAPGLDYIVQIIPKGSPRYTHYLALCTNKTPSSPRIWGYF